MHYRDNNEEKLKEMKDFLNIKEIKDLYSKFIDKKFLDLDFKSKHDFIDQNGKSEFEVKEEIKKLGAKNKKFLSFLGAGAYDHFIPSIVDNLSSRSEFLTSYTPYQAEASQGTLQYIFEYQSLVAELLGMDVVNASHYDGSASIAEAIRLAYYFFNKKKKKVVLSSFINPEYTKVIKTYLLFLDIELVFLDEEKERESIFNIVEVIDNNTACVLIQNPNFFGQIKDLEGISKIVHENDSVFILHTDPIYASAFKTPGDLDVDIATAEGQPLGIPLSFGGPYLGIFSSKEKFLRKLPGRLSGETIDKNGKRGFVLTLSTREQHIKREKSLSNICSNQSLMSLRALIYMAYMGKDGIYEVAMDCFNKINYLKLELSKIDGFYSDVNEYNFNDLLIKTRFDINELFDFLYSKNIIAGSKLSKYYKDRDDEFLLSVSEKKSLEDIDNFILKLKEFSKRN